ncbi:MAG: AI-2E family transporter [Spirochaetales bacterium]|nr:AI-2E family transporter [Spirochaetales bacterium]
MDNKENLSPTGYVRKSHLKINYIELLFFLLIVSIAILAFLAVLPLMSSILIAVIIFCIASPMVAAFERRAIPSGWAAVIVFVIISAIAVMLFFVIRNMIPSLNDITKFGEKLLDGYTKSRDNLQNYIQNTFNIDASEMFATVDGLIKSMFSVESVKSMFSSDGGGFSITGSAFMSKLFGGASNIRKLFSGLTSAFSVIFVATVVLGFLLIKGREFERKLLSYVPNKYFEVVVTTWHEIAEAFSQYIKGTIVESIVIGLIVSFGWYVCGVKIAPALIGGLIVGILNAIPYFGPALGLVVAIVMPSFELIDLNYKFIAWSPNIFNMGAVIVISQVLDQFIKPAILGSSVSLPGMVVFISIIAGGKLFGFLGLLFAVPIVSIFKIVFTTLLKRLKGFKFFDDHMFSVESEYVKKE